MLVQMLRNSRILRSFLLTIWFASFLVWLYIVARIVINNVDVHTPFLDTVPSVSFESLGVFAFGLSCVAMFAYLWLWGRFATGPRGT